MRTFPLVRVRWSNEHIMAALFLVLVLYLLPGWVEDPINILSFSVVLIISLIIDVTANFLRYKNPTCAVSAAVTAVILQILAPGVPLWGMVLGIAVALLAGKHLLGGTGKNVINPAITGLLLLSVLFDIKFPTFSNTLLLLPAIILSLPFIRFRPFAAIGFMAGMLSAMMIGQDFLPAAVITYGVIFWSCLIVTDPVTVTVRPVVGIIAGFLSGFFPVKISGTVFAMALGVISLNIISYVVDNIFIANRNTIRFKLRIKRIVPFAMKQTSMFDITRRENAKLIDVSGFLKDKILKCIKENDVFGFGGAAYPTYEKIEVVIGSKSPKKYFIINGVECDPGLIHDKWIMCQYPEEVYRGIELLGKCLDFESVVLAVKDIEGLKFPEDLKVYKVSDYYPAGAEKVLIKEVLKQTLSHEAIPAKEGILILNVQTVFSIYEAVYKNMKADNRFLTVANIKDNTGIVAKVKLGTRVHEVMEALYPQQGIVFCGGGLMQSHMADDTEVVDKTVNFIAIADFPRYKESQLCSRCGLCTLNCPAGLMAGRISELVDSGDLEKTRGLNAQNCLNCGSCSFVCLAGRNLSSRMKIARDYLKAT